MTKKQKEQLLKKLIEDVKREKVRRLGFPPGMLVPVD